MKRFALIPMLSLAAAMLAATAGAAAAEPAAEKGASPAPGGEKMPPPPPRCGKRDADGAIWSAFARLSDAERKEMLELQCSDSEKFRAAMLAKAKEYRAARAKRHAELRALAEKIRQTTDAGERETLRRRLVAEVKTDFLNRLAEHRRRIEGMKAHAAKLEKALDQRTAEVDKVVEKAVQAMIEGREPKRPPRKGGMFPPVRERAPRPEKTDKGR